MLSGMCVGWIEDKVSDHQKEKAAVMVPVWDGFPDLNVYHSSLPPESFS